MLYNVYGVSGLLVHKGYRVNAFWFSIDIKFMLIKSQKGIIAAPLTIRRVITLNKVYGVSTLLVLKGYRVNAFLFSTDNIMIGLKDNWHVYFTIVLFCFLFFTFPTSHLHYHNH